MLPSRNEMIHAFTHRDASYEGIFYTGVLTTGIFCRPTCSARKPLPKNVTFFASTKDALDGGFRPCKRCKPLEAKDNPPDWVAELLQKVDQNPSFRWKDQDLRNLQIEPERARRWFKTNHGMTFHAYSRARRLGKAMGHMKNGQSVTESAFDAGYESMAGFTEAIKKFTGHSATVATQAQRIFLTRLMTPVGPMIAGASEKHVVLLEFVDRPMLPTQLERIQKRFECVFIPEENTVLAQLRQELAAYFEGRLQQFLVPLDFPGTDFQHKVWTALLNVPYGSTASYLDLATAIGDAKAVRAVARANGDNRIAILIPCHRIIGSDGSLTGYGGGLHRKKKLLDLEQGVETLTLFG